MSKRKRAPLDPSRQLIRNSTAEFLIFTGQAGEQSIEARYEDETTWLTHKLMATLFDVTVPTINQHLANIHARGELAAEATIRKFRTVHSEVARRFPLQVVFRDAGFKDDSAKINAEQIFKQLSPPMEVRCI